MLESMTKYMSGQMSEQVSESETAFTRAKGSFPEQQTEYMSEYTSHEIGLIKCSEFVSGFGFMD